MKTLIGCLKERMSQLNSTIQYDITIIILHSHSMDQKMERVKILVGNNNFYVNRVNLNKLKDLELDEEIQEKQRKKIQKWMKDKEEYVE